jgi:ABC-type dipeptide/oligopeptide/nickel transport system permease subunit
MNVSNTGTGSGGAPRAALAACALVIAQLAAPAFAGPNEQAKRIYERIAGVPPSAAVLQQMAGAISAQPGQAGLLAAAAIATSAPSFYDVTLKNFVMPWTNRDHTVFAPLNDYVATVIGMVRDDLPFNTALSADILYTSNAPGLPAPSPANNDHYAAAEANGVDLMSTLVQGSQSGIYGTPAAATAGLITTRGAASAFFLNGTNRAMFRFTMINHFCSDMPALMDTTRPSDRIRQDVARSPGGDSRIFLNNCVGCHSGMDPMVQAFAYYNFDATSGQMLYTPGQVQPKYLINATNFPFGFVTPDDSWSNRWRTGQNSVLGWDPTLPGSGNGAKSLGTELGASDAFAQCQVVKVFQAMCFRAPLSSADVATVASIKASFKSGGYKLKQVFQQAAAACPGQ